MICWDVDNAFTYVPLDVNSLSSQGPACSFGSLTLRKETVQAMADLCSARGNPVVFDFSGIRWSRSREFEIFSDIKIVRPVVFINVNAFSESRLRDDGISLEPGKFEAYGNNASFWVGSERSVDLPEELATHTEGFFRGYLASQKDDALIEWDKVLPSTPVHATQYYSVKKLCIRKNLLQIVAAGLARAIIQKGYEYDFIISSSHTGSFLAVPVSMLIGKPLHCWPHFGPAFRPKRQTEWTAGKGKECLLVADVVCMGTETRAVEAFLAASGSRLVACAALATYLQPKVKCVSLLRREDLERMGYILSIPKLEANNVAE